MADEPRQTQEQSIKARKHQLFDDTPKVVDKTVRKPFKDHLRETPAAPISGGVKAALWAVGVVVALMLVAAILKGTSARPRTPAKAAVWSQSATHQHA